MDSPNRINNLFEHGTIISRYPLIAFCVLALLVIVLYSRTLSGPFVFDDNPNILENTSIRLEQLTIGGLLDAAFKSTTSNRPVANLSFALNFYFSRFNRAAYHLVNILIHIGNGILLFLLTEVTLATPWFRSRHFRGRAWIPFFAAVLWATHPIQTQSVSYIVQRMNTLAAGFFLLSIYLYAKARLCTQANHRWMWIAGCIASGMAALGSKEIAVTLPFFIGLYEWYFFQDLSRKWALRYGLPLVVGAVIFSAAIALIYLGHNPVGRISADYVHRDFNMSERLFTEFRVIIFYITLILWPHPSRLNLDHDFQISHSLLDPITTLISVLTVAGLVAVAIISARKHRLMSFAILWFLGNLMIESSFIGLEIIFEHRLYLPSAFLAVLAATAAFEHIRSNKAALGLMCALVAISCLWTYQRNFVWQDAVTLWQDCALKSPRKARPHNNLGDALSEQGRFGEAAEQLRTALQLDPDYEDAHYNLGCVLIQLGDLPGAIRHLSEALRLYPRNFMASNNLGVAYLLQGRLAQARTQLEFALKIRPDFVSAHNNLGIVFTQQGDLSSARDQFSEVLRLDPGNPKAQRALQQILEARQLPGLDGR